MSAGSSNISTNKTPVQQHPWKSQQSASLFRKRGLQALSWSPGQEAEDRDIPSPGDHTDLGACEGPRVGIAARRALPGPPDVHPFSCHGTLQPGCVTLWHCDSRGQLGNGQFPWAEEALSAAIYIVPSRTSCVTSKNCHLTFNSELNPPLISVLPIESNARVEAAIFHSHLVDDQGAIGQQLVSGKQTVSSGEDEGVRGQGKSVFPSPMRLSTTAQWGQARGLVGLQLANGQQPNTKSFPTFS